MPNCTFVLWEMKLDSPDAYGWSERVCVCASGAGVFPCCADPNNWSGKVEDGICTAEFTGQPHHRNMHNVLESVCTRTCPEPLALHLLLAKHAIKASNKMAAPALAPAITPTVLGAGGDGSLPHSWGCKQDSSDEPMESGPSPFGPSADGASAIADSIGDCDPASIFSGQLYVASVLNARACITSNEYDSNRCLHVPDLCIEWLKI
jgi:hypothetical protein